MRPRVRSEPSVADSTARSNEVLTSILLVAVIVLALLNSASHRSCNERRSKMPNSDEMKGRIKEAAGDLTDDKDLQREGKVDQASGKAKDTIDKASDKAKDALDRDD
jgi:uncharacterized protein YjbJ (UPF0337 family)